MEKSGVTGPLNKNFAWRQQWQEWLAISAKALRGYFGSGSCIISTDKQTWNLATAMSERALAPGRTLSMLSMVTCIGYTIEYLKNDVSYYL